MDKQALLEKYKYKIELHAHSMPASQCCNCPQERFLELYSQMGVDAVCITNHYYKNSYIFPNKSKKECIDCYLDDYEKLKAAAKSYGIKILLGCEIRFADNTNDYLMFGVNRDIIEQAFDYLGGTLEEYRKSVSLPDTVFVQAHPFRDNMVTVDPKLLDGIETMNFHPHHNSRNSVTAAYAKANNITLCTGGSDFHHDSPYHPAALVMLSKTLPEDSFELAKILKENDYLFLLGDNHIIIP